MLTKCLSKENELVTEEDAPVVSSGNGIRRVIPEYEPEPCPDSIPKREIISHSGFRSVYESMDFETLLSESIPDHEMPQESRLAYVRRCCYFERRGGLQVKQMRYRVGKVLGPFRDQLKQTKEWEQWVEDNIPRTPRTVRTWIHFAEKAPIEAVDDPDTSYSEVCRQYNILSDDGRVRLGMPRGDGSGENTDIVHGKANGGGGGNGDDPPKNIKPTITLDNVTAKATAAAEKVNELLEGIPRLWPKGRIETAAIFDAVLGQVEGVETSAHAICEQLREKLAEVES